MRRPFKIGERVRTQLTATERNKMGGKKIANLKSKRFIVVERHNNTYKLQDEQNLNSRLKQRHFNESEPARNKFSHGKRKNQTIRLTMG